MGGWREGRVTLNSLGSGWFRFREWFVFCFGWSVGGSCLGCLVWSGLVWFGLVWLYSRLGEELLLVLFCFVCLFVSCCMLYAACCTRSVFARF